MADFSNDLGELQHGLAPYPTNSTVLNCPSLRLTTFLEKP